MGTLLQFQLVSRKETEINTGLNECVSCDSTTSSAGAEINPINANDLLHVTDSSPCAGLEKEPGNTTATTWIEINITDVL